MRAPGWPRVSATLDDGAESLLALLLAFAQTPWYRGYATTTLPWRLEQLADQHLAGAIMWVPAGLVYLGAALTVLAGWLRSTDAGDPSRTGDAPPGTCGGALSRQERSAVPSARL